MSGMQPSDSDTTTITLAHDWISPRERDAMECRRCGLYVSMTEYARLRDTACDDWPTTKDAA